MAFQSSWRTTGEYRRRVAIAEKMDARLNDPSISPIDRAYRRDFIARNLAAVNARPANVGDEVLDSAQASSDDHEVDMHGGNKFGK